MRLILRTRAAPAASSKQSFSSCLEQHFTESLFLVLCLLFWWIDWQLSEKQIDFVLRQHRRESNGCVGDLCIDFRKHKHDSQLSFMFNVQSTHVEHQSSVSCGVNRRETGQRSQDLELCGWGLLSCMIYCAFDAQSWLKLNHLKLNSTITENISVLSIFSQQEGDIPFSKWKCSFQCDIEMFYN